MAPNKSENQEKEVDKKRGRQEERPTRKEVEKKLIVKYPIKSVHVNFNFIAFIHSRTLRRDARPGIHLPVL